MMTTMMDSCGRLLVGFLVVLVATSVDARATKKGVNCFPEDFLLGSATSSYQIEGAWNVDGKGENVMDYTYHLFPDFAEDRQNGDVACNSYYLYEEDVRLLKEANCQFYRFSISWARIFPTGEVHNVNEPGVRYYNNLINKLLKAGIKPVVTMFHWDLPQFLQKQGGLTNDLFVTYFADYATFLYHTYGDRVKHWITMNEPIAVGLAYSTYGLLPPGLNLTDVGMYLVGYNLIRAHAKAWHIYDKQFRREQQGKVGITMNSDWIEPLSDDPADLAAAERGLQFWLGYWSHPIFSREGDYPDVVKKVVNKLSMAEGRPRSRLIPFTKDEIDYIRGSADFLGLNHYRTTFVTAKDTGSPILLMSDSGVYSNTSLYGSVVPEGLRKLLNWVHKEYPDFDIFITESGIGDEGGLEDGDRVEFYYTHLAEVLKAVNLDKVPVIGYTAWSLIDNFEWFEGYTVKFGIYSVDFNDPKRPRTPKASARALSMIYANREVPIEYFER